MEMNDRARDLVRGANGLSDRGGFLGAWLSKDNARLKELLAGALPQSGDEAGHAGWMVVRRGQGGQPLVVHVNPAPARESFLAGRSIGALVLVVDPGYDRGLRPQLVAEALGLTPAESMVAAMLSVGKSVRDIAVETNRKEKAVYWLLQQIYRKHGISRQADVVRLVLSLRELPGVEN